MAQWAELRQYVESVGPKIDNLAHQRAQALNQIAQERASRAQLEAIHRSSGDLSVREKKEVLKSMKATAPGQLVTHVFSEGVQYVSRVNPGEFAEIDSMTEEIRVHSLLAVTGATQIVESSKNK